MPARQPVLRWDKTNNQHYIRFKSGGKLVKKYMGRDRGGALKKFRSLVGADVIVTGSPMIVVEGICQWRQFYGLKKEDWKHYLSKDWLEFCGDLKWTQVSKDHLVEFAQFLVSRKQSPQTVIHKVRCARQILEWCVARGWLGESPPMPALPRPVRHPKDVRKSDLRKAFAELPSRASGPLRFILNTGCRPSEACNLRWEDVDLESGSCALSSHKTQRTGKTRTIYLTPDAKLLLGESERRKGFVFLSRFAKPYTPSGLRSILRKRGIKRTYSLRHTFAQHALDSGVPIEDVAKLLGHADLRTFQVYAQVRDARATSVASRLRSPLSPERAAKPRRRK